jgi:Flp pilus assembly protein TadG
MTIQNVLTRLRSRRGAVTVLAATLFPVMVGMAGLATSYGDALLTKLKAQRIADAAAYAGALAYSQLSTTTAITGAADRVATVNGISTSALAASLVTSPSGDGNNAVEATVTLSVNVALTKLISSTSSVTVTASSYVELKNAANGIPCIIALNSSGTGVTLSGGTSITANACAVSSDSATTPAVTVPNGTTITTPVVSTPAALTSAQKANISPPSGTSSVSYLVKSIPDPLASNSEVTTAAGHLSSVGLLGNPTAPTAPSGSSITFNYSASGHTFPSGCSGSFNGSSSWTVTCTGAGPFNFGSISLNGGISVAFTFPSSTTANFNGSISNTGSSLTFAGGSTYNIVAGLYTGGGTTTAFNSPATYNIGKYTSSCSGDSFSICHTGTTLAFAGPSTFVLTNGLYNAGGSVMTLGTGSTSNSYQLGSSTNGYSMNMGGGTTVTLNDATGSGDLFQAAGNISNGGGSCLTLPAATAHDINGSLILGGGATLGAGVYTIYDYLALGAGGGGAVTCNGTSIGIKGSGVTLVIGANSLVSCGGTSVGFCITGGYSNVTLTAPTTGSTANIAVMGPTSSSNTAGAILTAGASGANISGAFYFPYGAFTMSGGASVGGGACLELIAEQVTLSGGSAIASTCSGLIGSNIAAASLVLVQ